MNRATTALAALLALAAGATPAAAQTFTTDDPVIHAIWAEGNDRSMVPTLMQTLSDSIGPRLTGTPEHRKANDWLVKMYGDWGIEAENEQVGTWRGWRRGYTHVDLVQPRVRTLDAMLLGWSPGTARPVEGAVVALPAAGTSFEVWLSGVRGKYVLTSAPEVTCRPVSEWESFGGESAAASLLERQRATQADWNARVQATGLRGGDLARRLEEAGAAGILTTSWTGGYGARRVFSASTETIPSLSISCEDYGLLFRLAENGQGPMLRVDARAEWLGEVPTFNTIAVIPGTERPDEYVLLSAHMDSWDGGSGSTDNGTGTVTMLEAMRLLRAAYPNPKRTIVAGHWTSEEQGLNGSRAYAADHPEVVRGLQALFNQDNGTGEVANIGMQGLSDAGAHFGRWLAAVPEELSGRIDLRIPGTPGGGGSDYAAFICYGAPAFGLSSNSWDYFRYTWHTNLDTFDKVSLDNVRDNAVLTAMLAYMASEDPETVSRARRSAMPTNRRTGEAMEWPSCSEAERSWEAYRGG